VEVSEGMRSTADQVAACVSLVGVGLGVRPQGKMGKFWKFLFIFSSKSLF
jgi:hypothetical protein